MSKESLLDLRISLGSSYANAIKQFKDWEPNCEPFIDECLNDVSEKLLQELLAELGEPYPFRDPDKFEEMGRKLDDLEYSLEQEGIDPFSNQEYIQLFERIELVFDIKAAIGLLGARRALRADAN